MSRGGFGHAKYQATCKLLAKEIMDSEISSLVKSDQVRRSADVVAQIRHLESLKAHPLVHDPYAHLFISDEGDTLLWATLEKHPYFAEYLIARERYFDLQLEHFFMNKCCRQLVILGSGNDMRAQRLAYLNNHKIFEVDFPDQIQTKQAVLKKVFGEVPRQVVYVEDDVTQQGLMGRLQQKGFDSGSRVVFLLQGLIYYLTPPGVDNLFEELTRIPALGNVLLLDQITPDMGKEDAYPENVRAYLSTRDYKVSDSRLLGDLTQDYYQKKYESRWWVISALR
jgi:methyltransferase (TIGR00027 family)